MEGNRAASHQPDNTESGRHSEMNYSSSLQNRFAMNGRRARLPVFPHSSTTLTSPAICPFETGSERRSMAGHHVPNTRIPTLVFKNSVETSRHAARLIEKIIRDNNAANRRTVLGLATGSTPVGLYRELIQIHKAEGLDFCALLPSISMNIFRCPATIRSRIDAG